jgi:hypothetical protein
LDYNSAKISLVFMNGLFNNAASIADYTASDVSIITE